MDWPADKIKRRKVDDLIPYARNARTLIAAEKNGRHSRLMELDPKYCDVIVQRWCEFTGKDATLESDGTKFDKKGEGFSPLIANAS